MRTFFIILGTLGAVFILAVGGCVACTSVVVGSTVNAIAEAIDMPKHHNRSAISQQYGAAISSATEALTAGSIPTEAPIVAVMEVVERQTGPDDHTILHPNGAESNGYMLSNGVGTCTLTLPGKQSAKYPAWTIESGDKQWLVCFEDWTPGNSPQ